LRSALLECFKLVWIEAHARGPLAEPHVDKAELSVLDQRPNLLVGDLQLKRGLLGC
jgi:hypothetical protein